MHEVFFKKALNLTFLANPFWTPHYLLDTSTLCLLLCTNIFFHNTFCFLFLHSFVLFTSFPTNTHNLTLFSCLPTNTHNFIFYYSLTLNTQEFYKTQWFLESSFKMHTLNKFCNQHKLRAKFRWPWVLVQKVMWYPMKSFCKHLVPNFAFWPSFWWNLGFWCHVS